MNKVLFSVGVFALGVAAFACGFVEAGMPGGLISALAILALLAAVTVGWEHYMCLSKGAAVAGVLALFSLWQLPSSLEDISLIFSGPVFGFFLASTWHFASCAKAQGKRSAVPAQE
jgi:hypothetical protein